MTAVIRACHPEPCVAVTAFAVLLAVRAGDAAISALVGAAVLAGQLTIGWGNDRFDVARDRAVGRTDKPLAAGTVDVRTVDRAMAVAAVTTVVLSLTLGWRAGLVHLLAVGFGLSYNVLFKATWWSWLPYACAFGLLPAVASLANSQPHWPEWWLTVTGAVLGVGAHLLNALPDLDGDVRTGVRGLPQRLGAGRSLIVSSVLLLAGSLVIVFGPAGAPSVLAWVGLGVDVVALAAGMAWQYGRPPSRVTFLGMIVVVGVNVVLLATTG